MQVNPMMMMMMMMMMFYPSFNAQDNATKKVTQQFLETMEKKNLESHTTWSFLWSLQGGISVSHDKNIFEASLNFQLVAILDSITLGAYMHTKFDLLLTHVINQIRSKIPPNQGAFSRLNFHTIWNCEKCFCTSGSSSVLEMMTEVDYQKSSD